MAIGLKNNVGGNNCTYDAAGNMIVDPNGYQYAYDYENRIVEIKDSGNSSVAEYAYDALGRRIKVVDSKANGGSGETTYYYYNDQWQVLVEYASYDTWKAYNIFGNYIDETLLRGKYGSSPYVYAHDHLYSTVAAVNIYAVDETIIFEQYEYDAYGNVHVLDGDFSADADRINDIGNPYTFTGRRLDVLDGGDLKIMYYRNRYYHPELGRFMTHDPLGYVDGLGLYQYVKSDPLTFIDPLGFGATGISACGRGCYWSPTGKTKPGRIEYGDWSGEGPITFLRMGNPITIYVTITLKEKWRVFWMLFNFYPDTSIKTIDLYAGSSKDTREKRIYHLVQYAEYCYNVFSSGLKSQSTRTGNQEWREELKETRIMVLERAYGKIGPNGTVIRNPDADIRWEYLKK